MSPPVGPCVSASARPIPARWHTRVSTTLRPVPAWRHMRLGPGYQRGRKRLPGHRTRPAACAKWPPRAIAYHWCVREHLAALRPRPPTRAGASARAPFPPVCTRASVSPCPVPSRWRVGEHDPVPCLCPRVGASATLCFSPACCHANPPPHCSMWMPPRAPRPGAMRWRVPPRAPFPPGGGACHLMPRAISPTSCLNSKGASDVNADKFIDIGR